VSWRTDKVAGGHSVVSTALVAGLLTIAIVLSGDGADANGIHNRRAGAEEPATRFERFVVAGCVPCVIESYPGTTLPIGILKLPAFPRQAAGAMMRQGELRFEALRAYELGRPSRQSLAIRVSLSVAPGMGGELYRMAVGLVDEDDVPALGSAVTEILRLSAAGPLAADAESAEVTFQGGSLRIGLIRFGGDTAAYVQAGDISTFALRPAWEVGSTMYLRPEQLSAFAAAVGQLAARIKQLRGP